MTTKPKSVVVHKTLGFWGQNYPRTACGMTLPEAGGLEARIPHSKKWALVTCQKCLKERPSVEA
jgi:hypothetical protein